MKKDVAEVRGAVYVVRADYAYWLVFTAHLSNAVVSAKFPFYFSGSRSSVSLIGSPVACSARTSVDAQTDRQTNDTVTLATQVENICTEFLHLQDSPLS